MPTLENRLTLYNVVPEMKKSLMKIKLWIAFNLITNLGLGLFSFVRGQSVKVFALTLSSFFLSFFCSWSFPPPAPESEESKSLGKL